MPIFVLWSLSATQFRWIQKGEETEKQSWAIDHVYIGEACPKLCSGRGYCTTGAVCICDEGFQGLNPAWAVPRQDTVGSLSYIHRKYTRKWLENQAQKCEVNNL